MSILHFTEAVKLLELETAINYRNTHNPSDDLPYHNNQHMNWMLEDCINAYIYQKCTDMHDPADYFTMVFYAAIFHDCAHSGTGMLKDEQNIINAVAFWDAFVDSEEGRSIPELYGKHQDHTKEVVSFLIKSTQYPYVPLRDIAEFKHITEHFYTKRLLLELAATLRDADLMTIYHGKEGIDFVNDNLYKELTRKGSVSEKMDYDVYVVRQAEFLQNVSWHSAWGKHRAVLLDHSTVVSRALADLHFRQKWSETYN